MRRQPHSDIHIPRTDNRASGRHTTILIVRSAMIRLLGGAVTPTEAARANLETCVAAIAINSKGLAVRPQIDFLRPS
jgi:hypothetical protein